MLKQIRFDPAFLKDLGRRHWKEFQPTKFRQLKSRGQLEPALSSAVELTLQAMADDRAAGYSQWDAWEKNRSLYLLLPEEDDPNEEPMPDNPAWDALVEKNRMLDQMANDDAEDD